jgi:hypothetical protein
LNFERAPHLKVQRGNKVERKERGRERESKRERERKRGGGRLSLGSLAIWQTLNPKIKP